MRRVSAGNAVFILFVAIIALTSLGGLMPSQDTPPAAAPPAAAPPIPDVPPSVAETLWNAESLSDFTACGWGYYNPQWPPDTVLSDEVVNGVSWMKSEIANPYVQHGTSGTTRAQAFRWVCSDCSTRFDEIPNIYGGARILLPSGFDMGDTPGDWCLLFQMKEQGGRGGKLGLEVLRNGNLKVGWSDSRGVQIPLVDNYPSIIGRPFTIVLHVDSRTSPGLCEAWIDGVKVGELRGDFSVESSREGRLFSIGLYQKVGTKPTVMYFRNCVVAETLEDCLAYLEAMG